MCSISAWGAAGGDVMVVSRNEAVTVSLMWGN